MKVGDLVRHKPCGYVGIIVWSSREWGGLGLSCWTVLRITGELRNWWGSDMEVINEKG
jgi:hypothetical protein